MVNESPEEPHDTINWLSKNEELFDEHGYNFDKANLAKEQESLRDSLSYKVEYNDDYIADTKRLQKAAASVLRTRGVTIESCPTSNLRIGQVSSEQYHPLRCFREAGLNVVVGTDDPGIFDIDWETEDQLAKSLSEF